MKKEALRVCSNCINYLGGPEVLCFEKAQDGGCWVAKSEEQFAVFCHEWKDRAQSGAGCCDNRQGTI